MPTDTPNPRTKVFISYSRTDIAFVERLAAALQVRGIAPSIDRSDISVFEDWWRRIQALILDADTIIFVISPAAVKSDICRKEVQFAYELSKRLAPIVFAPVAPGDVPAELSRLNYLFFDNLDQFEINCDELVEALLTDIEWVRKHTQIGGQARRWAGAGRPGTEGLLLRSPDLEEAERWLAIRPLSAPSPTELHSEFILASRAAAQRQLRRSRQRSRYLAVGSVSVALVVSWLGWLFLTSSQEASRSQSLFLADAAEAELVRGDAITAQLLMMEALPDARSPDLSGRIRPFVPAAAVALDSSLRNWTQSRWTERSVLYGNSGAMRVAEFSPDGRRIITVTEHPVAYIWDVATRRRTAALVGHAKRLRTGVFAPDGQTVATGSEDETVKIWDAISGRVSRTLSGFGAPVTLIRFSPNMKMLATGSEDHLARIWDLTTGQLLHVLRGHSFMLWALEFSPDGQHLLTTSEDGTARVWSAASGDLKHVLQGHTAALRRGAFSPDSQTIATASTDKTVKIWSVQSGQLLMNLAGHKGMVWDVVFATRSKTILTASEDKTAAVWDLSNKTPSVTFSGHDNIVRTARFSPDETLVLTASVDGTARIWDASSGTLVQTLQGHSVWVRNASFSPDGRMAITASYDQTARLWEATPTAEPIVLRSGLGKLSFLDFSTKGDRIIVLGPDGFKVLDRAGSELHDFPHSKAGLGYAAISPDERLFAASSLDKTVRVWDMLSRQLVSEIVVPGAEFFPPFQFSPDSKLIATGDGGSHSAAVWEANTGKLVAMLRGHEGKVYLPLFSADSKVIATSSDDGTVRIWDATFGNQLMALRGHSGRTARLHFTPDKSKIISASDDKTVRIWDLATGKSTLVLKGHDGPVYELQMSINGDFIATTDFGGSLDGGALRTWRAQTGEMMAKIVVPKGNAVGRSFSPDGRFIAGLATSSAGNNTAFIWETVTGNPVAALRGHGASVMDIKFSPDGRHLATASLDGTVRLWTLPDSPQAQLDQVRRVVPRCLTTAQRERFHLRSAAPRWCYDRGLWPYADAPLPQISFEGFVTKAVRFISGEHWDR